ncbi:MAG: FKBP-type peptidyl-prolyl cis-trans isomerase [Longimicrobiales bacterium]
MKRLLFALCGALISTTTVLACGDDPVALDEDGFAVFLNVDLSAMTETASGLYWQDFVVGQGDVAVAGGVVEVEYSGWLQNGDLFDGTSGAPRQFQVGVGGLIAGWDEGIPGMQVGGTRRLIIPPDLGYGAAGRAPSIPPNSTLVFDIQLLGTTPPAS